MKTTAKQDSLPSYPWYVSDWRGSKTRLMLSSVGRAIFRELIDYCWEVGFLPCDERTLLSISGATKAEFSREWPMVKLSFYEQDGVLKHAKVEQHRARLMHFRETRRSNARGKASAQASATPNASAEAELEKSNLLPIGSPKENSTVVPAEPSRQAPRFVKPTIEEIRAFCVESKITNVDAEQFWHYYEARGWKSGKTPVTKWKSAVHTWKRNGFQNGSAQPMSLGWEDPD